MSKSSGKEEFRANADTTKMPPEDIKAYGVESAKRPPGHNPGGVLHQRRSLPYNPATMAVGGFVIAGVIGYGILYYRSKPGTQPRDVSNAITGAEEGRNLKTTTTK